jgi:hypothetical protein
MKTAFTAIMAFAFMSASLHAQFGLGKLTSKAKSTPTTSSQPAATATADAQPAAAQVATAPVTPTATTPTAETTTTAAPSTTTPAAPAANAQPVAAPAAPAQPAKSGFGRFMSSKAVSGNAVPAGQAVVLIRLVTRATDQGMQAMDIMASIFPPEKVAKFEESSKKYHELQANRKNGNIDADQCQVATDAAEEFAKLDVDWNSYRKEKAIVVSMADHRLAYMLLADGLAATHIPGTVISVKNDITSLISNPLQIGKARQLGVTVVVLTAVAKQMPKQLESFKTVRGIVKKIAVAENITLAPDPPANLMKDPVTAVAAIDKDLPPEPVTANPVPASATSPGPVMAAVPVPPTAPVTPSTGAAPAATAGGSSN